MLARLVAPRWSLARLAAVDRAVLRIGAYELFEVPDRSQALVINEAVVLARRFGTDDSPRFVNGVLSAVAAEARPARGRPVPRTPSVNAVDPARSRCRDSADGCDAVRARRSPAPPARRPGGRHRLRPWSDTSTDAAALAAAWADPALAAGAGMPADAVARRRRPLDPRRAGAPGRRGCASTWWSGRSTIRRPCSARSACATSTGCAGGPS